MCLLRLRRRRMVAPGETAQPEATAVAAAVCRATIPEEGAERRNMPNFCPVTTVPPTTRTGTTETATMATFTTRTTPSIGGSSSSSQRLATRTRTICPLGAPDRRRSGSSTTTTSRSSFTTPRRMRRRTRRTVRWRPRRAVPAPTLVDIRHITIIIIPANTLTTRPLVRVVRWDPPPTSTSARGKGRNCRSIGSAMAIPATPSITMATVTPTVSITTNVCAASAVSRADPPIPTRPRISIAAFASVRSMDC
mmetsp:Transcript_11397/g.32263  ORF Transcript_11397/g.32263 Transcript_11397/m.32263 type:complete len:251 (-) Transcript_11397:1748-2500(-)